MIVVGIDGSEAAKKALRWAMEEARLRGTSLRAVYAWSRPSAAGWAYVPPDLADPAALEAKARDLLVAAVDEVADSQRADVQLECAVVEGPAAQVLIDAAKEAELLVVGSRGHGGFTGLLLGSVSHQVAHHAPCPVVVVRQGSSAAQETAQEHLTLNRKFIG